MNIGIIIYSQTGHTRDVADQLAEQLQKHHSVKTEYLKVSEAEKGDKQQVDLTTIPAIEEYDCLILGSPVHAFSLAPAMETLLKTWPELQGKTVGLIMTQHFPYPWMGGNRAMNQFKNLCRQKGADLVANGIINWSNKKRPEQIQSLIADFTQRLSRP